MTDLELSPATRIIDRMKPTLEGRCIAILVDEGSNAESVAALRKAVEAEKAAVKIIAPKVDGIKLSNGDLPQRLLTSFGVATPPTLRLTKGGCTWLL